MGAWGARAARELLSFIQLTMPPGSAGALGADVYANIAAFILQSNGARPGNEPLTVNSQALISSVASGPAAAQAAPPAGGQQAAQGRGAAPAGGQGPAGQGRGGPPAAPAGITVAGEVRNYVPVTEAMLRNPDPGDWLMIRRDYRASNYSPLTQITRDNVKNLRLVWSWAMNEGGTNQPAPIVHNGVIYLNNPGNTIQALDGKTGDVIWENRYGTAANAAAMRGISMLRRQDFCRHERCASVRVRRQNRQDRLGDDDRRSVEGQLHHQQRPARRQGQGDPGARRLPDVSRRKMLHQRVRCRHRQAGLEVQHGRAGRRARWRHLGQASESVPRRLGIVDHRQLRSGAEPHVLGNGAGEAVDAGQPRHVAERRRALLQFDRRARRRYGQARLAFSARARRSARSRRRLRAPPRRRREPEPAVHGRQGRHPVEARSKDRTIPRATRKPCFRTSGRASIPRPAGRSTGRTSSSSRSSAPGSRVVRAPRAGTTGRRRAITRRPIS